MRSSLSSLTDLVSFVGRGTGRRLAVQKLVIEWDGSQEPLHFVLESHDAFVCAEEARQENGSLLFVGQSCRF